ncbi:MAG TPA: hypothetical protein VM600_06660, partial [Actinomycetota bacterium]|nr:hypothetical protein [Actinomycetota bacterium]
MNRVACLMVLAACLATAGSDTTVQHQAPAAELLCVGNRVGNKCDIVWLNYSVESRATPPGQPSEHEKVNCPRGTSTQPECCRSAEDVRGSSAGWGSAAGTTLAPRTTVGPVDLLGVAYGSAPSYAAPVSCLRPAGGRPSSRGHPQRFDSTP